MSEEQPDLYQIDNRFKGRAQYRSENKKGAKKLFVDRNILLDNETKTALDKEIFKAKSLYPLKPVAGDKVIIQNYDSDDIRCEIATEGAYDGIGLWNLTDGMQVSTSHEEVIVSERVADKYQTRVYPMSGQTVAFIIGNTRLNLLMDIIENCAVMNQRMVETEVDITNH